MPIERFAGSLVVSCQAERSEPLGDPSHILALCRTVVMGGAKALRLEGSDNISLVRKELLCHPSIVIIGLTKIPYLGEQERLEQVYITPTFEDAKELARAGSDIIATDATDRPRPDGLSLAEFVERVHKELNLPVWADAATTEQGLAAAACGVDIVSTTLHGYTAETANQKSAAGPAFVMLKELSDALSLPVVLEGRIWTPEEARHGFELGAHSVVVGSAITRPQLITGRFLSVTPAWTRTSKTSNKG